MKLRFFTPACGVSGQTFGAASFGFVGCEDENAPNETVYPEELRGTVVCGTYAQCLQQIPEGPWQAGIVLLGNAGGENAFIHALAERTHAPLTGGAAAFYAQDQARGLITGRSEAAVFMIADERFDVSVCCQNIHRDILGTHTLSFSDPRIVDRIDGEDACAWFARQKARFGLAPEDFEHLTLADENGVNAHLSVREGKLCSGRDVRPQMLLRYAAADQVLPRMRAFYDDPGAIVFGCAGLKGILPGKLGTDSMGLFLFGEVCTTEHGSEFGNLMLSKLRLRRRDNAPAGPDR